jgi:cytoskeletal protein RodZ
MKETRFPGHLLRARREALGHALDDVHALTHVPQSALDAIEEGRLNDLPVKAYTLGFIQSYCRFLGVPEEPFVDQFHSYMNEAARSARSFAWINPSSSDEGKKERRPRWVDGLFTWATVCAVIVFGWFAYSIVVKPLADSWQGRVEAGSVEIAPPTAFDKAR